ncbi:MAG: glutamyl-tRNA reductase [Deltaproteobacteria bacterium]|nr:MAG: glutamyl-tRNA reductase [Deltaproteobacteria bacterium]
MNLIVAGLSYKTSPVEIREKLSFSSQEIKKSLKKIVDLPEIYEGIILSTCNRVEIFFSTQEKEKGIEEIKNFLSDYHQIPLEKLTPHLYFYSDQEAIKHVFRVASSLDSMILGEPQILGQLKDAYRNAVECKTTGLILNRLLHKAFFVAKRVRTETNIASSAVSVSFAAVELARKIFDKIDNKKVLLIGAGEMAELVTQHLISNGVKDLFIANRTFERAQSLVKQFGGRAIAFEDISLYLSQVDIVISSINASHFIITPDQTQAALKMRKNKPLFMIDISVPRTLDPRINNISNVYLYDIDDLEGIVETNKQIRKNEAKKAEEIIEKEKLVFLKWLKQQEVTPTIKHLKEKVERIRQKELEKTISKWKSLNEKEKEKLDALTRSIVNKILHDPITYLKNEGIKNGLSIEEIQKLFRLDEFND